MNRLPGNSVLSVNGDTNEVTIRLETANQAYEVFNFLRSIHAAAGGTTKPLVNKTGNVCSRGGVEKVRGISQMVVGGEIQSIITDEGDDWFEAQTENEKTFRFNKDDLKQVDGNRWFDFD